MSAFLQLDPRHTGDPRSHRAGGAGGPARRSRPGWQKWYVQQYLPDIEACGALPLAATGEVCVAGPPVDLAVGSGVLLAGQLERSGRATWRTPRPPVRSAGRSAGDGLADAEPAAGRGTSRVS